MDYCVRSAVAVALLTKNIKSSSRSVDKFKGNVSQKVDHSIKLCKKKIVSPKLRICVNNSKNRHIPPNQNLYATLSLKLKLKIDISHSLSVSLPLWLPVSLSLCLSLCVFRSLSSIFIKRLLKSRDFAPDLFLMKFAFCHGKSQFATFIP